MTPKILVSSNFIFITGKIKIKISKKKGFWRFLVGTSQKRK